VLEGNQMNQIDQISTIKQLRERTNIGLNECKKALTESNWDINAAIELLQRWGQLKSGAKATNLALEGKVIAATMADVRIACIAEINCQTDFNARSGPFNEFCHQYMKHILCLDDLVPEDQAKIEEMRQKLVASTGENVVIRRQDRFDGFNERPVYMAAYNHPGNRLACIVELGLADKALKTDKNIAELADDIAMHIAASAPMVINSTELAAELVAKQEDIFQAQLIEEKKPEASWPKILPGKLAKWKRDLSLMDQEFVKEPKITVGGLVAEVSKKLGTTITINRFVRYALGETTPQTTAKTDLAAEVAKMIE
jgi:elongation factor Ts